MDKQGIRYGQTKIEYVEVSLSTIIRHYKNTAMVDSDWSVMAIDPVKDIVIFKCFRKIKKGNF